MEAGGYGEESHAQRIIAMPKALVIAREGYDRLTKTVSVVNMRVSGVDEE